MHGASDERLAVCSVFRRLFGSGMDQSCIHTCLRMIHYTKYATNMHISFFVLNKTMLGRLRQRAAEAEAVVDDVKKPAQCMPDMHLCPCEKTSARNTEEVTIPNQTQHHHDGATWATQFRGLDYQEGNALRTFPAMYGY